MNDRDRSIIDEIERYLRAGESRTTRRGVVVPSELWSDSPILKAAERLEPHFAPALGAREAFLICRVIDEPKSRVRHDLAVVRDELPASEDVLGEAAVRAREQLTVAHEDAERTGSLLQVTEVARQGLDAVDEALDLRLEVTDGVQLGVSQLPQRLVVDAHQPLRRRANRLLRAR